MIDTDKIVEQCKEQWYNTALCNVNDCVVRLGIVEGEFHWHKHDREDEFFFVISGRLLIDLEDRNLELHPHQGYLIPRSVLHRTRAPERTVMLAMEGSTVIPTGD
ncbi:MAG: cupin domain-containing protein [Fidelibacterota bacterium]|nr:MAG: cupin domain-containing protein [Candidatus Neomarinimicrobiota bacterium]